MKNLALALAMTLLLAACSSGSTVAPLDVILNGVFSGTFENTEGTQSGTATFNLAQVAGSIEVTGNAIYDTADDEINTCLVNGVLTTSTNSGLSASITVSGTTFQLAISGNGDTLSGSYVTTPVDGVCSVGSGSGQITLNRV